MLAYWALAQQQGSLSVDYLMGRFDPSNDARFVRVDAAFSSHTIYMRKEAHRAFVEMHAAAKKDGVRLLIISATRSFEKQKMVWEEKWSGKRPTYGINTNAKTPPIDRARAILRYSAMPGTSRHHWGTDIDINSVAFSYWRSVEGKKVYAWLQKNAARYGFCQTYSLIGTAANQRKTGYQEEVWHWSYMPVSRELLKWYLRSIRNEDIKGFSGAETAVKLDIINQYVRGINPNCQ